MLPEKHINNLLIDTFILLRNITIYCNYMDKTLMRKTMTTIIRPKLECPEVVESLQEKKTHGKMGRVQRIATKLVPKLKELL